VNDYLTSFETSVALKEAGVYQGPGRSVIGETFWRSYQGYPAGKILPVPRRVFEIRRIESDWTPGSVNGKPEDGVTEARAFRLDELLAALHGTGWQLYEEDNLDYAIGAEIAGEWQLFSSPPALPWSPVEAAAACLLAVLRAAREAKP
jgi:hypothetical protein